MLALLNNIHDVLSVDNEAHEYNQTGNDKPVPSAAL